MTSMAHHQVLIVGGGTAGITVAASLRRRAERTTGIAVIEPADEHYYQPAFTLVGAGVYAPERTRRRTERLIPRGVRLIPAAAKSFDPANNTVGLSDGASVSYDYLVVCTGVELDWDKIDGLAATLGRNGVCSNYSPASMNYTWDCLQALKPGSRVVFTQPQPPFKCPGAPQKIAYLTGDHLRRRGILERCSLDFFLPADTIFSVPYFARELLKIAARYRINVHYRHNLVAVDGAAKKATVELLTAERKGERIVVPFDMLHVVPPQSAPAAIRNSPLVDAAGWVEVDANTLQHVRYSNVFSLGDVCSTPNSKTAAAVRKQAPVVVRNILNLMAGRKLEPGYDGYASCPLTTAIGKVIMAEFIYGGKVTPSLPFDPSKESRLNWWIKVTALPLMYWHYMLRGREWFPAHNTAFAADSNFSLPTPSVRR